jgi:hypothetical protein
MDHSAYHVALAHLVAKTRETHLSSGIISDLQPPKSIPEFKHLS